MNTATQIEGFEIPLHIALTQPVLMGGAPRTFAILNGTLALVVGHGPAFVVARLSLRGCPAHRRDAHEQARSSLVRCLPPPPASADASGFLNSMLCFDHDTCRVRMERPHVEP